MSDIKKGSPALQLSAVQKSYGDHRVLCGIDLKVMPGQILGLLGKNGAGKSTLIEILCGLRQADSGLISVCGMNPAKESVGHLIGYAPQDLGIYPDLTVMENLTYYGQLEGLSRKRSFARAEEVMNC
ncbi:ATP-binding cassette domain-containing protein [Lancefieldella rimae]|uniref:ATP-binding cassette domain-containing protein n=1 Tax=Lancefieldella rimae TaxID=1383 RepID=UPI00288B48DD|nr:ATP-binding cassette domain-containing protein [Lancefieldella rimae]